MGTARDDLLDRTIAYVAGHGVSDLSLRELASGIGTSHRMLLYHFGDRAGLVAAIVGVVEQRQRDALEALAATATSPQDLVRAQWAQLTDPTLRPFVALFFELVGMALQGRPGTEGLLDGLTEPWLEVGATVAARLGLETTRAELLLGVAVTRGLLLEAVASGDATAAGEALERYLAATPPGPTRPAPTRGRPRRAAGPAGRG